MSETQESEDAPEFQRGGYSPPKFAQWVATKISGVEPTDE